MQDYVVVACYNGASVEVIFNEITGKIQVVLPVEGKGFQVSKIKDYAVLSNMLLKDNLLPQKCMYVNMIEYKNNNENWLLSCKTKIIGDTIKVDMKELDKFSLMEINDNSFTKRFTLKNPDIYKGSLYENKEEDMSTEDENDETFNILLEEFFDSNEFDLNKFLQERYTE